MDFNDEAEMDDWIWMLVQYIDRLNTEQALDGISPVEGTLYWEIDQSIPNYSLHAGIEMNLSSALEHLSTVEYLLYEVEYFPPFSLFTLCRAALEALAQGMWVLAGTTHDEIITRRLRVYGYSLKMRGRLEAQGSAEKSRQARDRLESVAEQAGIPEKAQAQVRKPDFKSTEAMEAAGREFNMFEFKPLWQFASAVAHGLSWGLRTGTDAEEIEGSRNEFGASYRLTGNTRLLREMLYEAVVGYLLLRGVYAERCQGIQRPVGWRWLEVKAQLDNLYQQYLAQRRADESG